MRDLVRAHSSTILLGLLIGAPLTAIAMHLSFWLMHGAGYLGAIFFLLAVPGALLGHYLGIPGLILGQIVYYFFVARGVKALVLKWFFPVENENAS